MLDHYQKKPSANFKDNGSAHLVRLCKYTRPVVLFFGTEIKSGRYVSG